MRVRELRAENIDGIEDGAWTMAPEGATVAEGGNGVGKSVWLELIGQTRDACRDRHWSERGKPQGWGGPARGTRYGRGPEGLAREGARPSVIELEWAVGDAVWALEWQWQGKTVRAETLRTRARDARRWRTAIERRGPKDEESWKLGEWMAKKASLRRITRADALISAATMWIGAEPAASALGALTRALRECRADEEGARRTSARCTDRTWGQEMCAWMNRHSRVQLAEISMEHGVLIVTRMGGRREVGMDRMPASTQWLWSIATPWHAALESAGVVLVDDLDRHADARTRESLLKEAREHSVQVLATVRGPGERVTVR